MYCLYLNKVYLIKVKQILSLYSDHIFFLYSLGTDRSLETVCYFFQQCYIVRVRVEKRDDEGYRCRAGLFRLRCTLAHWDTSDRPTHQNRNGSKGEIGEVRCGETVGWKVERRSRGRWMG